MGHGDADFHQTERAVLAALLESRKADWDQRVAYHPPRTSAVVQAHEKARALVGQLGHDLLDLLPPSPEVVKALDALDLTLMHANAAIARHHPQNTATPAEAQAS